MTLIRDRSTWAARLKIKGPGGNPKTVTVSLRIKTGDAARKRMAQRLHDQLEDLISDLDAPSPSEPPSRAEVTVMVEKILRALGYTECMDRSVGDFVVEWLAETSIAIKEKTMMSYTDSAKRFAKWAESKDIKLGRVDMSVAEKYRDYLIYDQKLAPLSVDTHLSALSSMFRYAGRKRLSLGNPFSKIRKPRKTKDTKVKQEPFTQEDVEKLLAVADPIVRDAILLSATIGTAAVDTTRMRWGNIDMKNFCISYERSKTGTRCIFPFSEGSRLHEMLLARYENCSNTNDRAYLFPELYLWKNHPENMLNRFLARAEKKTDIVNHVTKLGRRGYKSKTWHSLRRTAINKAIDDGIPEDIRMSMFGHGDTGTHRNYGSYDADRIRMHLDKVTQT